ncbi:polyamine ABC transporter substrate-binding protein [Mesorhizobium sp. B2-4-19]|uniref:polyamine ABC transporter substrate-binding protein n=1 Tax=Mesorhizobium sp. B2-4-19 TaxID=2589930 RepID=UPI00112D2AB6|nr:polyamine ABC transporter substrate-binding protein [Mesorhizobium sp. B2-4-19]TPK60126.1 polyamine ABC transporter substrate-binding protein [Mesorhizobium sp. B2-4-19]
MRSPIFSMLLATLACGICITAVRADEEKIVNVYNWSDYIAPDTAEKFEKETGIKVRYDVYDGNEVLETKLLTGGSGYDVVYPSAFPFLKNQVKAGAFLELDKSKLANYAKLDPQALALLAGADAQNLHAVPYMAVTDGIGYNVAMVKQRMPDAPTGSFAMVFDVDVVKKFSDCGVAMIDAPTEIIPMAMNYLHIDPKSTSPDDLAKVEELLKKVRPYIRYFHSSKYINDLANGDICVVLGWSGDILQAKNRAAESARKLEIAYSIPKEGTLINFDTMAVPKDAPHPENARAWIDFNMRPDIAAANSSYVSYANPIPESLPLMDQAVAKDPGVFPPDDVKAKLFVVENNDAKLLRQQNRLWTRVVTGQ